MDENSPIFQNNPRLYYQYLTGVQRVPPMQAIQMLQQRYGPPKSNQQLAEEQARQSQAGQIAQGIGMLGGQYVGSQIPSLFGGGGAASGTGATAAGTGATTTGAGTAVTGGGGAGGAGAGGAGAAPIGATALPLAAAAITAQSLYESGLKDVLRGKGKKDDYTNLGLAAGTMGMSEVANIGLRLLGKRSLGRMMKTGKSDAQVARDDFRQDLKSEGLIADDWTVTLADGSKYNIGLDGKATLPNVDGKDGKGTRRMWEVDFKNPLAKYATDLIDPMIRKQYGGVKGIAPEQYTGILVNAVTSNAASQEDVLKNIQSVLKDSSFAQGIAAAASEPQQRIERPGKGKVARVSEGLYRTDTGRLQAASGVRQALERAYGKR